MYKIFPKLLLLLLIFKFFIGVSTSSIWASHLIKDDNINEQVFIGIIESFNLYSNFFNEVKYINNESSPVNANTFEEAIDYFSKGFDCKLAKDIVVSFTTMDKNSQNLLIIPTDGIPIIEKEDYDKLEFFIINNYKVVVKKEFKNYFAMDDNYVYFIIVKKINDKWKISNLALLPTK
ncbi:hypothetical protein SYNTR_1374 [Candidatus Syntrophocurvum alkaliphilum]|uniref:Uncharacterized protein n=1 Tax=Candidatus Syntrophocurvum alkaliphilum TaxID=2293317 RepID=A0A6I6DFZ3_9FIRM|nr:hypothetical protein [Candidatus Syntrophocurvum alkaliphilum]QGT99967.1 hypothetical protein SYNTR_1374 [Candidatus Syntrophocurvum alkaliphilum]